MKKELLIIIILSISLSGCNNSNTENNSSNADSIAIESSKNIVTVLPHVGNWTRNFEIGQDSTQYVDYTVWQDSIKYEMTGIMAMNYTIHKDTFVVEDNRWIGTLNDVSYVIFAKNITSDSISLLKQKVKNRQEAVTMSFPSDSATSRFTTWNIFYSK